MFMKRTRLPKELGKKNKKRMLREKAVHLLGAIKEGEKHMEETAKELTKGGASFLHELIYLETPEQAHSQKLVSQAQKLIVSYPSKDVWLNIILANEPDVGAGINMVVRAEDLVHFNELEAEDVDSGSIYLIKRTDIFKIVGAVKEEKPVKLEYE